MLARLVMAAEQTSRVCCTAGVVVRSALQMKIPRVLTDATQPLRYALSHTSLSYLSFFLFSFLSFFLLFFFPTVAPFRDAVRFAVYHPTFIIAFAPVNDGANNNGALTAPAVTVGLTVDSTPAWSVTVPTRAVGALGRALRLPRRLLRLGVLGPMPT